MPVYVFGSSISSVLAIKDEHFIETPKEVPYFAKKPVTALSARCMHGIALSHDGSIYTWGLNDDYATGRTGNTDRPAAIKLPKIAAVSCGTCLTTAVDLNGRTYAWGTFKNGSGHFGFMEGIEFQRWPYELPALRGVCITRLACGANHVVAVSDKNDVYTWGTNDMGQLGRAVVEGSRKMLLEPRRAFPRTLCRVPFVMVACGANTSFVLNEKGELYGWGLNNNGELGLGYSSETVATPTLVPLPLPCVAVSAGRFHTLVLLNDSRVYSSGLDNFGQLGHNKKQLKRESFTKIENLSNVKEISAGDNHSMAVTKGNDVYAWGFSSSYQLGFAASDDVAVPRKISFDFGDVISVYAGLNHSFVCSANEGFRETARMDEEKKKKKREQAEEREKKKRETLKRRKEKNEKRMTIAKKSALAQKKRKSTEENLVASTKKVSLRIKRKSAVPEEKAVVPFSKEKKSVKKGDSEKEKRIVVRKPTAVESKKSVVDSKKSVAENKKPSEVRAEQKKAIEKRVAQKKAANMKAIVKISPSRRSVFSPKKSNASNASSPKKSNASSVSSPKKISVSSPKKSNVSNASSPKKISVSSPKKSTPTKLKVGGGSFGKNKNEE